MIEFIGGMGVGIALVCLISIAWNLNRLVSLAEAIWEFFYDDALAEVGDDEEPKEKGHD